jgi:hypothetical protein
MPTHSKSTDLERQSGSEKLHGDPLDELAGTGKKSARAGRSRQSSGRDAAAEPTKSVEERQDDLESPAPGSGDED